MQTVGSTAQHGMGGRGEDFFLILDDGRIYGWDHE